MAKKYVVEKSSFGGGLQQGGKNNTYNQTSIKIKAGDFASLTTHLREYKVRDDDIAELELAVEDDGDIENPQKFGPKVSAWIRKMTSKAASGSWDVSVRCSWKPLV